MADEPFTDCVAETLDEETLKRTLAAAKDGDAAAQCAVGCHFEALGDWSQARHWHGLSCAAGNGRAAWAMCIVHSSGRGGARSERKAIKCLKLAAQRRWPMALLYVANFTEAGMHGFKRDEARALKMYEELYMEFSYARAAIYLAACLFYGRGGPRNVEAAHLVASKLYTPDTMYSIGTSLVPYRHNDPHEADRGIMLLVCAMVEGHMRALQWLKQYADQYTQSRVPSGIPLQELAYDAGRICVARGNKARAQVMFRLALSRDPERGHAPSADALGRLLYEEGETAKALDMFRRALKMKGRRGVSPLVELLPTLRDDRERNTAKAAKILLKCAEAGDLECMLHLARCFKLGMPPMTALPGPALVWYTKAVGVTPQPVHPAVVELGEMHLYGWGGQPRNFIEALQLFSSAKANAHIALMAYHGLGMQPNYELAFQGMQDAVVQYPALSVYLGECYELGRGVARDAAKAEEWYNREDTPEALHKQSERALAANDTARAIALLERAVERFPRSGESCVRLALLLQTLYGVERDVERCWALLCRAAAHSSHLSAMVRARYALAQLLEAGDGRPVNLADAYGHYHFAAWRGHPEAMVDLGRFVAYSKVPEASTDSALMQYKDRWQAALYWFTEASKAGSVRGMRAVAQCYEGGFGVERDVAKAAEWRARAAEGAGTDEMMRWYSFALEEASLKL